MIHDFLIVGGGLVGNSFATSLHSNNYTCAIIEAREKEKIYNEINENRGLALSLNTLKLLEELNVLQDISEDLHPIEDVIISESGKFGFMRLSSKTCGQDKLGALVSSCVLSRALYQSTLKNINCKSYYGFPIKAICYDPVQELWTVSTTDKKFKGKYIIAADGTNSFIRKCLDISTTTKDYEQIAFVTNIFTDKLVASKAYEIFIKQGIIALLPFGKYRYKLVIVGNCNFIQNLYEKNNSEQISFIQKIIGFSLGKFTCIEQAMKYPIKQVRSSVLVKQNVVLIGNAANTISPIAAQGYNLSMKDVDTLSTLIKKSRNFIEEYPVARLGDHNLTVKSVNFINDIFDSDNFVIKNLRNKILVSSNFIPYISNMVAKKGMNIA